MVEAASNKHPAIVWLQGAVLGVGEREGNIAHSEETEGSQFCVYFLIPWEE